MVKKKESLIVRTKMLTKENRLNSIKLDLSNLNASPSNYDHKFEDSEVRETINELGFDNEDNYSFFKTTANPEADEVLRKNYEKFKKKTCTSWHFNTNMMNFLLELIHTANTSHIYFPAVKNIDVHSLQTHVEQIYWPVIHVLRNSTTTRKNIFTETVNNVLEDQFDKIEEYENPQNYNLEAYQLLKKREIKPLILEEGPVFTGAELKKAMDWLFQYRYTMKYIDNNWCDD